MTRLLATTSPLRPGFLLGLLLAAGCDVPAEDGQRARSWSPAPEAGGGGDDDGLGDTGAADSCLLLDDQAYSACVTDAQCDPGSACTTLPGYGGSYCAPPCDPEGDGSECDPDGLLDVDTVCTEGGRCARACGEPDSCPEGLDCQLMDEDSELGGMSLCAGEPSGQAGHYGVCTHPQAAGIDCPEDSMCFGGEFLGIDEGICLPYCHDGTCQAAPDEAYGVTGYCIDGYLEEPVCVLLCYDGSTCPERQECVEIYSGIGLCAPEGTEVPDDLF